MFHPTARRLRLAAGSGRRSCAAEAAGSGGRLQDIFVAFSLQNGCLLRTLSNTPGKNLCLAPKLGAQNTWGSCHISGYKYSSLRGICRSHQEFLGRLSSLFRAPEGLARLLGKSGVLAGQTHCGANSAQKKQPNAPQNARSGSGSSRRTRRRFFCLVKHSVCFGDSLCLKLGDAHTVLLIHFVSSQCLLSEDPRRGVTCQELLESQANSRMFLAKSTNTSNEPRSGTCLVCDLPYFLIWCSIKKNRPSGDADVRQNLSKKYGVFPNIFLKDGMDMSLQNLTTAELRLRQRAHEVESFVGKSEGRL